MRKTFETEPALFVSGTALDHPSLHGLDDTEAVLDWARLEAVMDGFIQRQTVTAGNVHDSQERDTLLLGDETALSSVGERSGTE